MHLNEHLIKDIRRTRMSLGSVGGDSGSAPITTTRRHDGSRYDVGDVDDWFHDPANHIGTGCAAPPSSR
jgi:hypothetical protein